MSSSGVQAGLREIECIAVQVATLDVVLASGRIRVVIDHAAELSRLRAGNLDMTPHLYKMSWLETR